MFKRRKKAGVTLLELLIAIAVIVIGLSGVAASLYFGFEKSKHGDEFAQATQYSRMLIEFVSKMDLKNGFPPLGGNGLPQNGSGINDNTGQAPRHLTEAPFEPKQFLGYWSEDDALNDESRRQLDRYTRNIRLERLGAKGTPEEFLGRITVTVYWPKEDGGGGKNYVTTSTIIPLSAGIP